MPPQRSGEPATLRDCMARYQKGDADAFAQIYQSLRPQLRAYFKSLVGEPAVIDDLVQDTFLQIHRGRRTFSTDRPVTPWVFGIARHVYLMHRRRMRRHRPDGMAAVPLDDVEMTARDWRPDRLPVLQAVRSGLHHLGAITRAVILLRHLGGWTYREVSARLGISEQAARLRSSRGVALLRQVLADFDVRRPAATADGLGPPPGEPDRGNEGNSTPSGAVDLFDQQEAGSRRRGE